MFIPFNTDAPLYHRPLGTAGLVAANVGVFWQTVSGGIDSAWVLTFGEGLHPHQWVTAAFLHGGPMHLIGNMFFLWSFGLIIEGKIGTLRFLALYFGLCLADGGLTQVLMLGADGGGAIGASGVIYALMAIALLWAPLNHLYVVWYWWWGILLRAGTVEIPVWGLSALYLGIDLVTAVMIDFRMSTPVLHLLGAAVGFPVGYLLLRNNGVDCENWDLFSIQRGDHRRQIDELWNRRRTGKRPEPPVERPLSPESAEAMQGKIERLVTRGLFLEAARQYEIYRQRGLQSHPLHNSLFVRLIEGLRQESAWRDTAVVLEDYLALLEKDTRPSGSRSASDDLVREADARKQVHRMSRARLTLAAIYARELSRPRAALKALRRVDQALLTDGQKQLREQIIRLAQARIDEGVLELAD